MKVLIIDDEPGIRRLIKDFLKLEGISSIEGENGIDGYNKLIENLDSIELIVLDVMMPEMDGIETLKNIKKVSNIPVIMLTAKSDDATQLESFDIGADDYVAKPFSPTVLVARIKNKLKKISTDIYEINNLKINTAIRKVHIGADEVILTATEFDLLLYLVKNKGQAMSRENISKDVWGSDKASEGRVMDTYIKQLRYKLKDAVNIETVRGYGFSCQMK